MRNPTILFSILLLFFITSTTQAQSGWFLMQFVQNTTPDLTGSLFVNGTTGYKSSFFSNGHVGFGDVAKSTNGGYNWVTIKNGNPVYGFYFLNELTGWTIEGYWSDAPIRSREVFRTTNGGLNFQRMFIDSLWTTFSKVFFADINTGWILLSQKDSILKSTNSGTNWIKLSSPILRDIFFINTNTGWGVQTGYVYKSTNGGTNWTSQNLSSSANFYEVYFKDINTGWICGGSSFIYKTTNSGTNWISYNTGSGSTCPMYSIEMIDYNTGWVSGDSGKIFRTTNSGINWVRQFTPNNHILSYLCFPNALTGYARGGRVVTIQPYVYESSFIKTTNGGMTAIVNSGTKIPDIYNLFPNYPNPFNPSTTIEFDVPVTSLLKLVIYDLNGKEIETLVNDELKAGSYRVSFDGTGLSSGIYFYKLETKDYNIARKMILIK